MPLTQPLSPDRNHIASGAIKHWAKHWCVGANDVHSAIDKVGNSAGAVEKELQLRGLIRPAR